MEGTLFQLDFSAAFDRVSHRGLLYKRMSIGVGGQFLSLVSKFLSYRRKRVHLDAKISASFDVVSEVRQGSVFRPLLFILYTSELFCLVGNHTLSYTDNTKVNAAIPRRLSRPRVMESLNQDLGAKYFWCLKGHMRLNPEKTKSMVVSRSRTYAPGYGDHTLGGAKLEGIRSMRILRVTFDSNFIFEIHLHEA